MNKTQTDPPEKCMMLYAALPQVPASSLTLCFEEEGGFIALRRKQRQRGREGSGKQGQVTTDTYDQGN